MFLFFGGALLHATLKVGVNFDFLRCHLFQQPDTGLGQLDIHASNAGM